jgi:hypothetical protein
MAPTALLVLMLPLAAAAEEADKKKAWRPPPSQLAPMRRFDERSSGGARTSAGAATAVQSAPSTRVEAAPAPAASKPRLRSKSCGAGYGWPKGQGVRACCRLDQWYNRVANKCCPTRECCVEASGRDDCERVEHRIRWSDETGRSIECAPGRKPDLDAGTCS